MPFEISAQCLNSPLFYITLISAVAFIIWQRVKFKKEIESTKKTLLASKRIYQIILEDLDFDRVVQKIADTIPNELQFGTGVVAILDERSVIKRVGASKTKEAQQAIQALSVPFDKIEISVNDPNNLMARALREHKMQITTDVYDVLGPVLSREEAAKIQQIMGTKTTLVYPIYLKDRPIGVFLASTKKTREQLSQYELYIIDDFVNLVGLILQNSKLFTSLKETKENLSRVNLEVSQMNNKLQELDKLKDDFVSIASHELRTPMTAIRSYSWMALNRSDMPLTPKLKKYLERTLISTERLINLVNDMLNISRIESGRVNIIPTAFDVKTLVSDVLSEVEAKAKEKNIRLQTTNINLPQAFADPDKVHQVLLNLVGNALKFTPENGVIAISYFSDGQMINVTVKDSGVGISREDMARLFTKFGRLDNSYVAAATSGGTGLGLYICKNLIEMMKGKIWATSEGFSKGTAFTFSLPVATQSVLTHANQFTQKVSGEAKMLEPVTI